MLVNAGVGKAVALSDQVSLLAKSGEGVVEAAILGSSVAIETSLAITEIHEGDGREKREDKRRETKVMEWKKTLNSGDKDEEKKSVKTCDSNVEKQSNSGSHDNPGSHKNPGSQNPGSGKSSTDKDKIVKDKCTFITKGQNGTSDYRQATGQGGAGNTDLVSPRSEGSETESQQGQHKVLSQHSKPSTLSGIKEEKAATADCQQVVFVYVNDYKFLCVNCVWYNFIFLPFLIY